MHYCCGPSQCWWESASVATDLFHCPAHQLDFFWVSAPGNKRQRRHRLSGEPARPHLDPIAAGVHAGVTCVPALLLCMPSVLPEVGAWRGITEQHQPPSLSYHLPLLPAQRASRRVSLDVFEHLLRLDHSFHLKRNTGAGRRLAGVAGGGREPSGCIWHCPELAELHHTD